MFNLKKLIKHKKEEITDTGTTIQTENFSSDEIGITEVIEDKFSESETTLLSEELPTEGETTLLSEEMPTEGETTLLSEELPTEGETTLLSEEMPTEGETTLLSEEMPTESETTLLSEELPTEGETTLLSEEMPTEGETTLLSEELPTEGETTLLSADENYAEQAAEAEFKLDIMDCSTRTKKTVEKNVYLIGKDSVNMDFVVNDRSVSRHHATIFFENGSYFIMDNKSTNGTSMEGVLLSPFEKVELYDGAIISLGNVGLQIKIERR